MSVRTPAPNRQQLAQVFKDPETRIAMEALFRNVAYLMALVGPPATFPEGVVVVGETETDTLRLNAIPAPAVSASLFTLPIVTSSGTYYLQVSDAP